MEDNFITELMDLKAIEKAFPSYEIITAKTNGYYFKDQHLVVQWDGRKIARFVCTETAKENPVFKLIEF